MACCSSSRASRSKTIRSVVRSAPRYGRNGKTHAALMRKRDLIGERAWSALFQQTPLPSGGRLFSIDRIAVGQPRCDAEATVRAWDLAATGDTGRNDPDWTVGIKLSRDKAGRYLVWM